MNNKRLPFSGLLRNCSLCPHNCNADRLSGSLGYCCIGDAFQISSICIHRGEEPVISGSKGICNIFFNSCNLQCVYCQNYQISTRKPEAHGSMLSLEQIVGQIVSCLDQGCTHVGFVSPSHVIPQMLSIIQALSAAKRNPVFVYNSNGYDKVETLQMLEGYIDVYLPDFKYMDPALAGEYSGAADYPHHAAMALKEMYRQKGSTLLLDDHGCAQSGLIIRHLILPGNTENSKKVLRFIAEELSPFLHVSLMSQYYPTHAVARHPILGRQITVQEYQSVTDEMESLGMYRGWIQHPDSHNNYRPDFDRNHPFE